MTAMKLRNILIGCVVLVLGAIGTLIYFASAYLNNETTTTIHAKIDAELSNQDVDKLKNLEKVLNNNLASIQKANQIVSESKQYEYQDQIVNDINSYAAKTGVKITGYDFGSANTTSAAPTVPTTPTVSGVKTLNVTLTLASPMPFDNYLNFVKAVENNLTKMQVSGINITPDDKDNNKIANPSVILIVYVR